MARTKIDSYIPGAYGLSGVQSLLVEEALYANQARLDFIKTAHTYKIIKLPKESMLEMVLVKVDTEFAGPGTLELGDGSTDDAYIKDEDFPKTVGLSNPLMIGAPIDANTTVQLKVGSGFTAGAGKLWLFWRPLL